MTETNHTDQLVQELESGRSPTRRHRTTRWLVGFAGVVVLSAGVTAVALAANNDHNVPTTPMVLDGRERGQVPERRDVPPVLHDARERAQIAEWAQEHGLTGLAPESLVPIPRG